MFYLFIIGGRVFKNDDIFWLQYQWECMKIVDKYREFCNSREKYIFIAPS